MSHHDSDPEIVNRDTRPEMGYEYRDIGTNARKIVLATFWFMFFTTVSIVLTIPIQNYIVSNATKKSMSLATLDEYKTHATPRIPGKPNPLIQSDGVAAKEILELRESENAKETTSGWVDEKKGIAHIPVEDALKDVASKGLPKAQGGTP